jgi:hypothetical protein
MKKIILSLVILFVAIQFAHAQTVQDSGIWDAIGSIFSNFNASSLFAKITYVVTFLAVLVNLLPTSVKMPVTRAIDWLKQYDNYIATILRKLLELFNSIVNDRKTGGGTHTPTL